MSPVSHHWLIFDILCNITLKMCKKSSVKLFVFICKLFEKVVSKYFAIFFSRSISYKTQYCIFYYNFFHFNPRFFSNVKKAYIIQINFLHSYEYDNSVMQKTVFILITRTTLILPTTPVDTIVSCTMSATSELINTVIEPSCTSFLMYIQNLNWTSLYRWSLFFYQYFSRKTKPNFSSVIWITKILIKQNQL